MKNFLHNGILHRQDGCAMAETIVAGGILIVLLLGSIAFVMGAAEGNVSSRRLTKAVFLASEKLEDLKNKNFLHADLAPTATPCPPKANARPDPAESLENGIFTRYFCVSDLGAAPIKAKQVDVYVEYATLNTEKTTTMSTIIARIEP